MSAVDAANAVASTQARVQVVCSNDACPEHAIKRQRSSRTWSDKPCGACGSSVVLASAGGASVLEQPVVELEPPPPPPALPPDARVARLPLELPEPVRASVSTYRLLAQDPRVSPSTAAALVLEEWAAGKARG